MAHQRCAPIHQYNQLRQHLRSIEFMGLQGGIAQNMSGMLKAQIDSEMGQTYSRPETSL